MTLFIVDVSKYQVERPDPLDLVRAKAAGMGAINVALDRGRAEDVLPSWAVSYVDTAIGLGMGVSCYRWLDARLSGKESADRAYDRMRRIGGPDGIAHSADVESDAPYEVVRDYVNAMQDHLQRHVFLYTADWWWLNPARRWDGAALTPYLWAAPNDGYLPAYPGDVSPHWTAGYGGWGSLSAMQYGVMPLPGTGNCSLSAVRDRRVWTALATEGGTPVRSANMQVLTNQTKAKYPGVVIYGIGDAAHQGSPSGHNEDDTPGSKPEDFDADTKPEHRAIDVMRGPAFSHAQATEYVAALVTVPANQRRMLYVIYDRKIWRAKGGWKQETYTGDDPHTNHVHVSGEADDDENTSPWILDLQHTGGDGDMNVNEHNMLEAIFNGWKTVKLDTNGDGRPDQDFPVPLVVNYLERAAWDMHGLEIGKADEDGQVLIEGGPVKGRPFSVMTILLDIQQRIARLEEAHLPETAPTTVDTAPAGGDGK